MAKAKVEEREVVARLTQVFRQHGYEGATMARLAEATGLEKASLYHRYPGGKEDMVVAVMGGIGAWFASELVPLVEAEEAVEKKVDRVLGALKRFYEGGTVACILESLSLPAGPEKAHAGLQEALSGWMEMFGRLAKEAGANGAEARERAEMAIGQIEGGLVMARVQKAKGPFERALKRAKSILLGS